MPSRGLSEGAKILDVGKMEGGYVLEVVGEWGLLWKLSLMYMYG